MATAKKATAAPAAPAAPAKKRTPNAAFMKPLTPSPALAAVVGSTPLPRTEIISKLWVYIKANKLQDASNKRMINADAKLKEVFGKPQVSMFEMAGLIGKHVK
ncbi:MAG: SWIB/MDM2 domain-containing protein [Burkholderiaceae bacterium]|jgi:chromatin remodeling complex protein RSC6|nr:SWIB/MDM2 domain-containing protein [Burkholderiaceae bacterium]